MGTDDVNGDDDDEDEDVDVAVVALDLLGDEAEVVDTEGLLLVLL
jgi:hypothetical protein